MDWKKISLDDKDFLNSFIKQKNYCISDINFTNLFIWSFSREIDYKIINDCLCIKTRYENSSKPLFFIPIGNSNIKETIELLKKEEGTITFRAITPQMAKEVEFNNELVEERDRWDYIYLVEELIELKGRKFHTKKNHLNRFMELYRFEYEAIDSSNKRELLETYNRWFKEYPTYMQESLKKEKIAIENLVNNFEKLDAKGALLRVDGEIVAFSFGEVLREDMVLIHIEKANTSFHGAYQAINQQFLINEWKSYKYVNREEDLGLEGLRKAKLSYHPVMFAQKHVVELK